MQQFLRSYCVTILMPFYCVTQGLMASHLMVKTAVTVMLLGFVSRASSIAGANALKVQKGVRIVASNHKLRRPVVCQIEHISISE